MHVWEYARRPSGNCRGPPRLSREHSESGTNGSSWKPFPSSATVAIRLPRGPDTGSAVTMSRRSAADQRTEPKSFPAGAGMSFGGAPGEASTDPCAATVRQKTSSPVAPTLRTPRGYPATLVPAKGAVSVGCQQNVRDAQPPTWRQSSAKLNESLCSIRCVSSRRSHATKRPPTRTRVQWIGVWYCG